MSLQIEYKIKNADSPFWSFAIHDGHLISEDLKPYIALTDKQRLREEDPYTALIGDLPVNQFIVETSRFQVDLNREVENSVYLNPEQAWGLKVFLPNFPSNYLLELYRHHQSLYYTIERHIATTIKKFGFFVILDIHSYNAKRESADEIINTDLNPQINLGTLYNNEKWRDFIDDFSTTLKSLKLNNKDIDVRENIKFKGGNLAKHILKQLGELGCVISIEFRKDFMNEWTGEVYHDKLSEYNQILKETVESLRPYLLKIQV
ncbi:N-formylglutamate amidohydrolase [Sphingobacterium bovistauri]|uniref:N-formylglutamate amidohydrolase n=1 Tax=Sphingobacterium bovistauri TaxID=2781959 RepID=A0ABS7Z3Y3_9SPHI|nr:N-formylglutamate amidohydrolase [Sphingobacterium bovistauri]MCA5004891.1 N-formylglutamate amidohydrolase [Sphingobacterium bovistauri]